MRAIWLLLAAVVACQNSAAGGRPVIATVAGMPIYEDDFVARWQRVALPPDDLGAPPSTAVQAHKSAVLRDMVTQRLLLREAERAQINVMHEEVEAALARLRSGYRDSEFAQQLGAGDVTSAELRRELLETLTVRRYIRDDIYARVAVTDAEIETAVATQPQRPFLPSEVHVKQIVVKVQDDAARILQEIRAGMRFEDAAAKYSLSPEGKAGGDLGFFARGTMPSFFDAVCFDLPLGRPSEVIASPYGFHLFLVVQRRAQRPVDEVALQRDIEQRLRRDKERQALNEVLQALSQQAAVHIEEERLARLF